MNKIWQPNYAFAVCQNGAETALKRDVAVKLPAWRPAFSRPGFVTFKCNGPVTRPEICPTPTLLARSAGWSLTHVSDDRLQILAEQVWSSAEVTSFLAGHAIADLHVWQRDLGLPGERGFEPGPTALSLEVEDALRKKASSAIAERLLNPRPTTTPLNRWVLDVVIVEPNQWWIGCHRTASRPLCWPGGTPSLTVREDVLGRAYLKMAEALRWSAIPISPGERVVELGCAPGGAAQALLEKGLEVVGVDPAEVSEQLLQHPKFRHVRKRCAEVPRQLLRDAQWLAADMNVAPAYTLDAVEDVVGHPASRVRGLILTLKLTCWELLEELDAWVARVQGWGYRDVRVRQLAHNRREICLVALRSRGQRRQRRTASRRGVSGRSRHDDPHASNPAPHMDLS